MASPKAKKVIVEFKSNIPTFTFEGDNWCGRDIRLVTTQIIRAYRGHQAKLFKSEKAKIEAQSQAKES